MGVDGKSYKWTMSGIEPRYGDMANETMLEALHGGRNMNGEPITPEDDVEYLTSTRPFRGGVSLSFTLDSARRVAKAYTVAEGERSKLALENEELKKVKNQVTEELALNKKLLDEAKKIIALHQGK